MDPLLPLESIDNPHDPVNVLSSLVKGVSQGGLDGVLGDEVGLGDPAGHVAIDGTQLTDQLTIHSQERELAPRELPGGLGHHEVTAKVALGVGVAVGDPAIGEGHPGALCSGADIKINQLKLWLLNHILWLHPISPVIDSGLWLLHHSLWLHPITHVIASGSSIISSGPAP